MSKMAEIARQIADTNRLLTILCKTMEKVDRRLTAIEKVVSEKGSVRVHEVNEFYPEEKTIERCIMCYEKIQDKDIVYCKKCKAPYCKSCIKKIEYCHECNFINGEKMFLFSSDIYKPIYVKTDDVGQLLDEMLHDNVCRVFGITKHDDSTEKYRNGIYLYEPKMKKEAENV